MRIRAPIEWNDNPVWPGSYENFVQLRGLLVPKRCVTTAWATLVSTKEDIGFASRLVSGTVPPGQRRNTAGSVMAEIEIERGIPTIRRFEVRDNGVDIAITADLLQRIPLRDLANEATAHLCLTDRPETQYRLEPGRDLVEWFAHPEAYMEPWPVEQIPLPNLIDPEGRPWWQIVTYTKTGRQIENAPRVDLDPDLLREVLRVQRRAVDEGRRDTTQAVREWYEDRTGQVKGTSTVRKWIAAARKMDKGEDHA